MSYEEKERYRAVYCGLCRTLGEKHGVAANCCGRFMEAVLAPKSDNRKPYLNKMSDFEIEQAIRDAEIYASQDQTRRAALEVTQKAQKLLAQAEQALSKSGKQLEKAERKQVKADIASLRKVLFKTKPANLTEGQITDIRGAMNVLEGSSSHVRALAGE